MKTIFGPVNSRRFGSSLGIDLSSQLKQCNFDCLYCELSPSATMQEQVDTVAVEDIVNELTEALKTHKNLDAITFTANGEPSIYPNLNELVDEVDKIKQSTQTLILSNGANIYDPNIYKTLLKFDQVKLSVDAISKDIFNKIDRPYKDIDLDKILSSIVKFSKEYKGKLYLETLFVKGLNDTKDEIKKLNTFYLKLQKIQRFDLGSVDRPPAYPIEAISFDELYDISKEFDSSLPIFIASRKNLDNKQSFYTKDEILNTLDKRPLTKEDIEILFDNESKINLNLLEKEQKVSKKEQGNFIFYENSKNFIKKRKKH